MIIINCLIYNLYMEMRVLKLYSGMNIKNFILLI